MAHHLGNSAGGTRSSLAGSEEDEEIEDDESLFVASTRLLVFSRSMAYGRVVLMYYRSGPTHLSPSSRHGISLASKPGNVEFSLIHFQRSS